MSRTSLSLLVFGTAIFTVLSACSSSSTGDEGTAGPGTRIPIDDGPTDPGGVDTDGDAIADTIPKAGDGNGGEIPITKNTYTKVVENSCNLEVNEPETFPAKLELVVDVSSSMTQTAAGSTRSKWLETRDAITDAFVGPTTSGGGLPDSISIGLLFYPNISTNPKPTPADITTCVKTDAMIPMGPLGTNVAGSQRSTLRDALTNIQLGPQGTPTYDALIYGTDVGLLQGGASFGGQPYVVLITDGMPTLSPQCSNPNGSISDVDPQPIVDLIDSEWKQNRVKTFLVGSPGSEKGRAWMSKAAVLGQTAAAGCSVTGPNWCHMDLTSQPDFGQALRDGLAVIAGQVVSCNYDVLAKGLDQSLTVDPMLTTVMVRYGDGSSALVNRDDTPEGCNSGWHLDASKKQVVLCSDTCSRVQSDPLAGITVSYGCPTPTDPTIPI